MFSKIFLYSKFKFSRNAKTKVYALEDSLGVEYTNANRASHIISKVTAEDME